MGSARVSRAGCGVSLRRSFEVRSTTGILAYRKVRNGEDAIASARDACATPTSAARGTNATR